MTIKFMLVAAALMVPVSVPANSQPSNPQLNQHPREGAAQEQVVDSYCHSGYCARVYDRQIGADSPQMDRGFWTATDERAVEYNRYIVRIERDRALARRP